MYQTRLRFGAVNCATEHELCSEQKWPGHPLLVARYLGPDRRVHDAIEHWVDIVKDAQLKAMLPRYALPGEYPLLKVLLEQLPEDSENRAVRAKKRVPAHNATPHVPNMVSYSGVGIALCESTVVREYRC